MTVRPTSVKRRKTLVAVCTKCDGDSRALRRALRAACKRRGAGKTVRVVKTSCLDICPKGAVAVALADARDGRPLRYLVVTKPQDGEALVAIALE